MAHPIHQATEFSPFGGLTKQDFCKKHHVLNHESYMINHHGMKIFTQSWQPDSSSAPLRGIVAMIHGYTTETSSLLQLTAVAIAKLGFYTRALDLRGHGYSDGTRGHIPDINVVVDDCIQFFDSVRAAHPKLPAFVYGESLGGAIATLICLRQKSEWSGLILNGAMCGVSDKFLPPWPLTELLPVVAFLLPSWRAVITGSLVNRSFKEVWKRKLVTRSPNCLWSSRPTSATALEFLRVCDKLRMRCNELETPMLVVHGEDDCVCDSSSAKMIYETAGSKDKMLKIFPGMWHQLIGESEEGVEMAFGTIFSWLQDRADKARSITADCICAEP